MTLNKLADYTMILLSVVYSSFVCFKYLSEIVSPIPAGIGAVLIVILGHHYTIQAVQYFKNEKKIHAISLVGILLMGFVFYSEWNGQHHIAHEVVGVETTKEIDASIFTCMKTIEENEGKRNWQYVERYRKATERLKLLTAQKEQKLQQIAEQESLANIRANEYRFISVILYIIALIVSSFSMVSVTSKQKELLKEENEFLLQHQVTEEKDSHVNQEVTVSMNYEQKIFNAIANGSITQHKEVMRLLGVNVSTADRILKEYR